MTITQREEAARQLADLDRMLNESPAEIRDRVRGFLDFLRVQIREEPALGVAMAIVLAEMAVRDEKEWP